MPRFRLLPVLLALLAAQSFAASRIPARIVSLSPNTTEMLYGVGAFDRVVGVSQYCTYPPSAKNLPHVGGWQNSDIEQIVALKPDLVVLTDAQAPFIQDRLRAFGLQSLAVPSRTLADVFTAMESIGNATGSERKAAELIAATRQKLDLVEARTKTLPRPSVLLTVDRTPGMLRDLYVATDGSFLVDLIHIAGGRSIAAPAKSGYGKISKEAVLSLNPDLIIDLVHGSKGRFGEHPGDVWNDLPELKAVRDRRIYPLSGDSLVHASQFVADTAQTFARLIHPELFGGGKQ